MAVTWLETKSARRGALLAILALCLIVRLGVAMHGRNAPLTGDSPVYVQIAHSLVEGRGFVLKPSYSQVYRVTAGRDPLYPFFLAAVFRVFGANLFVVYLIQALLSTATCGLVYALAARVSRRPAVPPLSALFFAVYPPVLLSVGMALTETIAVFIFTAAVFLFVMGCHRRPVDCAAAGLMFGLAALSRGSLVFAPLLLGVVLYRMRGEITAWLPKTVVILITAYLVVAPWTVRNYIVLHGFFPVSSYGWQILWAGTGVADGHILSATLSPVDTAGVDRFRNPDTYPYVSRKTYDHINELQARCEQLSSEADMEALFRREAIKEIEHHPGRYAGLAVVKFIRLWTNLWYEKPPSKATWALAALNVGILLLAALGGIRGGFDRVFLNAALTMTAYITLISMVFVGVIRFSFVLMPLLLILAATGMVMAAGRAREAEQTGQAVPAGAA